jgi:hypothetical protein
VLRARPSRSLARNCELVRRKQKLAEPGAEYADYLIDMIDLPAQDMRDRLLYFPFF